MGFTCYYTIANPTVRSCASHTMHPTSMVLTVVAATSMLVRLRSFVKGIPFCWSSFSQPADRRLRNSWLNGPE